MDERCVPLESKESNFGAAKSFLENIFKTSLSGVMQLENIHRIRGEDDPDKEAIRYSELLKENIPLKNDFPRFDLIMLGIGEDGHTASIFPNQMHLLTSDKICEVSIHPVSGQKRITLTGKVLNNAERILFLVTGKEKTDVLRNIINKLGDYKKYPAAHICPVEGEMKWYLDSEAASKLIST